MRKVLVVKMPSGNYMGWGHDVFDREYSDPCHKDVYDRSGYLYEKDANPWKAKGGVLVEVEISAKETGKTGDEFFINDLQE